MRERGRAGRAAVLVIASMLGSTVLAIESAADPPRIEQPRDFGHFVGDVLVQRVFVDAGDSLEAKDLPPPDRVSQWFERRASRLEHDSQGRTWLVIEYQLINSPSITRYASLPALRLRLKSGRTVEIPQWPVSMSPLVVSDGSSNPPPLRDDHVPVSVPAAPIRRQAFAWLLAASALTVTWGLWLLWRNRRDAESLPFASTYRLLSNLSSAGAASGPDAWIAMHRALNIVAGRVIHQESLSALFDRAPELEPLRAEIQRFYTVSSARFFSSTPTATEFSLLAMCRKLRHIEKRGHVGGL